MSLGLVRRFKPSATGHVTPAASVIIKKIDPAIRCRDRVSAAVPLVVVNPVAAVEVVGAVVEVVGAVVEVIGAVVEVIGAVVEVIGAVIEVPALRPRWGGGQCGNNADGG